MATSPAGVAIQTTPTALGVFASVSAGGFKSCGIRSDGTVACWGYRYNGQATLPSGTFTSVSVGSIYTSGIQADGSIACWGSESDQPSPPPTAICLRQFRWEQYMWS